MEIVDKKISELVRAEYNPRNLTEAQREKLQESIEKFGLIDPIIINTEKGRENIIIGGHQRLTIWESLGNTDAPCVELKLNEEDEKELNVRLNKNTGEFDIDKLNDHFTTEQLSHYGFEEYHIEHEQKQITLDDDDLEDFGAGDDEVEMLEKREVKKKNILQIEFNQIHYGKARILHTKMKEAGIDIGYVFLQAMERNL